MATVDVSEFKMQAEEILRRVHEQGETIQVTIHGEVVALLEPWNGAKRSTASLEEVWADMDRLAEEIGKVWPPGVTAADAVKEQRREL